MRFLAVLVSVSSIILSDGAFAWELPVPASRFDLSLDVAVLPGGDVVAAGEVHPTNAVSVSDLSVTRYEAVTGARVWQTVIDGPATNAEEAADNYPNDTGSRVAVTSGGDVVAHGELVDDASGAHHVVIHLDGTTGTEQWRTTVFAGIPNRCCTQVGFVLDANDDVVVAIPGHVRKLDGATGVAIWAIDDPALTSAVAVNTAGNVVLTGADTVRLIDGGTGTAIWSAPDVAHNHSMAAFDANGDVIAVGFERPLVTFQIAKFAAADGAVLWRTALPTVGGASLPPGLPSFAALRVIVDATGDAYTAGTFSGRQTTGVIKVDGTGAVLWHSENDRLAELAAAPDGDVFATTTPLFTGSGNMYRIDGDTGVLIWKQTGFGLAVAPDGVPVVARGRDLRSKGYGGVTTYSGELTGRSLVVSDRPGVPSASKMVLSSSDPTGLVPWPGGPSDPVTAGGQLELRNPVTNESAVFPLPTVGWQNTTPPALADKDLYTYRYSDGHGVNGPCTKVELRGGKSLKATCRGAGIGFTLDEATQGVLEVHLTIGTIKHCMRFGGTVKTDRPGAFKATNAGPADCQ